MNNSYKEIYNILKKVRARFVLRNIFVNICIGSLLAVTVGIILSLVSRIIPIYKVYQKIIYCSGYYSNGFDIFFSKKV